MPTYIVDACLVMLSTLDLEPSIDLGPYAHLCNPYFYAGTLTRHSIVKLSSCFFMFLILFNNILKSLLIFLGLTSGLGWRLFSTNLFNPFFLSFLFPRLELLREVGLELLELVPETPPAAPASHIVFEVAGAAGMSARVVGGQREVVDVDQERRVEGLVVLAVAHALGDHVPREHMDVQVVHGGVRVDADEQLLLPLATVRQRAAAAAAVPAAAVPLHLTIQDGLAQPVPLAEPPVAPLQLLGREAPEPRGLGPHGGQELGVLEGVEGVQAAPRRAREQERVQGGLRIEVVDGDEGLVVVDDAARGEGGRVRGVRAELVADSEAARQRAPRRG